MPKISVNINVDPDVKYHIDKKLKNKKLSIEEYLLGLIENDFFSVVNFENDFSFNLSTDKLFHKNDEIKLKNLEKELFKYLLNNSGSVVSIEEIKEMVWKGNNMSVYTLRNHIKSIREKTYYELITNKSNHGYMMIAD